MSLDPVAAFLHRKALRRIRKHLKAGERIEAASPGQHDGHAGLIAVSNGRTFWIPKRGRVQIRRRGPLHDVRGGDHSGIVDARSPSWQVTNAPAGPAREVSQASRHTEPDRSEGRLERVERLHAQGMITDAEYQWMKRQG